VALTSDLTFEVISKEIHYRLIERYLDQESLRNFSCTCQHFRSMLQEAPNPIWKSICERILTQPVPSQLDDYKAYYFAHSSGRFLAQNMLQICSQGCLQGDQSEVTTLCVVEEKKMLVSGYRDGRVRMWKIDTMKSLYVWTHSAPITCIIPSGKALLIGSETCDIELLDIDTLSKSGTLTGHKETVNCLCSRTWNRAVSGSKDRTLQVWDVGSFTSLLTIFTEGETRHVEITQGKIISLIVSTDPEVRNLEIWNLESGAHLHTVKLVERYKTFACKKGYILLGVTTLWHCPIDFLMKIDCSPKEPQTGPCAEITSLHLTEELAIISSAEFIGIIDPKKKENMHRVIQTTDNQQITVRLDDIITTFCIWWSPFVGQLNS
jgi:WD40 repeat protein